MNEIVNGVILIVAGCGLVIFRKWLAHHTLDAQKWTFGINFDDKTLRFTERFAVPFGLSLITLGALTFFGVVKW